jgi:hypothetical protein
MAQKRRRRKPVRRVKVTDPAWQKLRAQLDSRMHRFNAEGGTRQDTEDYIVSQLDGSAEGMLLTLGNRAGADKVGRELDGLVAPCVEFLVQWPGSARIPTSEAPGTMELAEFRERLLRRTEHWKSMAFAMVAERTAETPEQRGIRRQKILDPMLQKAGIASDDVWAERAGAGVDRNTPRDYRSGKTKKLRRETREALAAALEIAASELPA